MPIRQFIVDVRAHIVHHPLWLIGVTAVPEGMRVRINTALAQSGETRFESGGDS